MDLPNGKENDSEAYSHLIVSGSYAYQGIGLVSLYIMCFGQSFALASKSETLWVKRYQLEQDHRALHHSHEAI